MCPTLDSTLKSLPKYLEMVLAFAGDSTITNAFDIISFLQISQNEYSAQDFKLKFWK